MAEITPLPDGTPAENPVTVMQLQKAPAQAAPPAREATRPTIDGAVVDPLVPSSEAWSGLSLDAGTEMDIPIAFVVAVGLFFLVQALVDRRDPKVAAAPERIDDESVGFE